MPCPSNARVHHRFDHRHRDAHFRHGLHAIQNIFIESRFAGRDLQLRGSRDAIHGLMKRVHHGLIGGVDADKHGDAQHDSRDGQQPARQMLADVGPANELQQNHEQVRARFARAIFFDAPIAQGHQAGAAFGHVNIVRDDQDRGAQPLVQIANQRENLGAGVGVQIAGGLVGQQNRRINRKRARDGAALAFAAGKLVRQVLTARGQAHQVQQLVRAFLDFLLRPSAQMQRNGDVFDARQRGQQIEELENESDLVAAQARQFVVGKPAQPAAVDFDFAR